MSVMEKRLQLLLDRERFARVEAEAARSGRSVAAVIREAIDWRFSRDPGGRAAAGARLLDSSSHADEPEPDWVDTKRALDEQLARKVT